MLAALVVLCDAQAVRAEKILYSFHGGSDGADPEAGLVVDSSGDLLGTTSAGGTGTDCSQGGSGCGTIFELAANGSETVLHSFQGGSDGARPAGGLLSDGLGDYYGTTEQGGSATAGTLFKLGSDGSVVILYAFTGGADGLAPEGSIVSDKSGNLFGTTIQGGNTNVAECNNFGCGVVYKLAQNGTESVLHTFQGGNDGFYPEGGVILDGGGNLYGATAAGGTGGPNCAAGSFGCGTVFKIASDGTYTVLHSFAGGSDGEEPEAGLLEDSAGNIYGTTIYGGIAPNCPFGFDGCGTVFKLGPNGALTILYAFQGGNDGATPRSALIMDKSGNIYGTTYFGGGTGCKKTGSVGCGTVFKLAPDGTETVLNVFHSKLGKYPAAPLLLKNGILYGTASEGGTNNDGVVFKLKK